MSRAQRKVTHHHQEADSFGLVSIIIPAYNAAPYIRQALDSVFSQTYSHYQVIVVNDGSPDTGSLESALAPYLNRVTYITQENRGLAGARNTGLRAATGDYVALLDSDDIWLPGYLAEQLSFLHRHPEFDLVYCNARFFGDSIHTGKNYMSVCPSTGEATAAAIIARRCHVFVSVLARREALLAVGFDESLRSCEDFDCWIRFTAAGYRIGYQSEVLVLYRKHKASLSANPQKMAEYSLLAINKSLGLWPIECEEAQLLRRARAQKEAELEMILGKQALRRHDYAAARTHLQSANAFYKSPKLSMVTVLLRLVPGLIRAVFEIRAALIPAHRDA